MLIQCDRCQSTYNFPEDRIRDGGLKAKCSSCGKVLHVDRERGLLNASNPPAAAPPPDAEGSTERATLSAPPPKLAPPIDAPAPRRRKSTGPVSAAQPSAPPGTPSVIVDMGQLGDEAEQAAAQQAAAQQAAFAPLAGGGGPGPEAVSDRHKVRELPAFDGPDPSEIQEIKPPSVARYAVIFAVVLIAGFTAWVASANDWDPIWYQDPGTAVARAMGFEQPPPPPPPPKPIETVPPMEGELKVEDVELTIVKQDRKSFLAILRGRVVNGSNRLQHSIVFDADLIDAERDDDLSLVTRKADCCAHFEDAEAKTVARKRDHAHFSDKSGGENVRLAPGESARFTILMRDLAPEMDRKPIAPRVRIRFAEVENPSP